MLNHGRRLQLLFLLLAPALLFTLMAQAPPLPDIRWIEGPFEAMLGDKVASVDLSDEYIFLEAEDTRNLMEYMGNPTNGTEVGLVTSKNENEERFIVFEYSPIGYVRDDEKENLDSDAILQAIRMGTEEANKIRVDKGFAPLNILGWYEEPRYDGTTNNLVWAVLAESQGEQVVNYNTRLLGRDGYMAVNLVTDPLTLADTKHNVDFVASNFSYIEGKRYSEFVSGDKVAQIGLTALVAGGAGAIAAKTGLLAKFWKLIAIGAVAVFGLIAKVFRSIFGKVESAA